MLSERTGLGPSLLLCFIRSLPFLPDSDLSLQFCISVKYQLILLFPTEQPEGRDFGYTPSWACVFLRQTTIMETILE